MSRVPRRKLVLLLASVLLALPGGRLHAQPPVQDSGERGLVLMTWNILHNLNPLPPANWSNRRPLVWQVIRAHRPDVLAMQEVLEGQLEDFEHEFGAEYAWVGRGHAGGMSGEILPVAWRRERFELVMHEFLWLSPTPEVAGSKGWGGMFPRVVTWVRLRDRFCGREFIVANNHWEADNDLMEARRESARILLERSAFLPLSLPVFLVGDFNIVPTRERRREPYRMLTEDGAPPPFSDAWLVAVERQGPDTTTNRLHPVPQLQPGERKDWILFRGPVQVHRVVVDDYHGGKIYPSDHLPVIASLSWIPTAKESRVP